MTIALALTLQEVPLRICDTITIVDYHYNTIVWNSVLQIILTAISTGTGPNETWSVPAIFSLYMY